MGRYLEKIRHYITNLILIWLGIFIYKTNKYYLNFLKPETVNTLIFLAVSYTFLGLFIAILSKETQKSRGTIFFEAIAKAFRQGSEYLNEFVNQPSKKMPKLEHHEKTTVLFMLVKLFFLPVMLNFFFDNLYGIKFVLENSRNFVMTFGYFNVYVYAFVLRLIFLIDTLVFSFSYAIESDFLKNKVKSVEPTLFGWLVALLSYPPFNSIEGHFINWYPNDFANFQTLSLTFWIRILLLVLFSIYLWATLSLGFKASNLTNRGIVSKGAYAYIRHPAYISKLLVWWITSIPRFDVGALVSMGFYTLLYFFRAITEERHLIKDPEYQEYCKKVKYRFIPYVY